MIEIANKYSEDLGNKIPESLLLIDKYKVLFNKIDNLKKYDSCKRSKYK